MNNMHTTQQQSNIKYLMDVDESEDEIIYLTDDDLENEQKYQNNDPTTTTTATQTIPATTNTTFTPHFTNQNITNNDEQKSDFLDSLQSLCTSLQNELNLIRKYFQKIEINNISHNNSFMNDLDNNNLSNYLIIEFVILSDLYYYYPIEFEMKIPSSYPLSGICSCRVLNCLSFTSNQCIKIKNKINLICSSQINYNCLIMIVIYLENKLISLSNKQLPSQNNNTQHNLNNNLNNNINNINDVDNANKNTFFDLFCALNTLKSDIDNNIDVEKKEKKEKILPSSFNSFEDILTTQTRAERKKEHEYALIDNCIISPKLCGIIYGNTKQLIYFNNILNKKMQNISKKNQYINSRNNIRTFNDYNIFINKCGAKNIHNDNLLSLRKYEFSNHLDEDEDRFIDEFVTGFALYQYNSCNTTCVIYNKIFNQNNNKRYQTSKIYHHNVLKMHRNRDTQHHIMPHLTLPSSTYINTNNDKDIKNKNKNKNKRRSKYGKINKIKKIKKINQTSCINSNSVRDRKKQGNIRIFFAGISVNYIAFTSISTFSLELAQKCKLKISNSLNVSDICMFNADLCFKLNIIRLFKIFKTLSTFLENISDNNIILSLPYNSNYIAKFIIKAIDELYFNNYIQGIAITACLLRQSQFFMLLFHQQKSNQITTDSNRGYLLQKCVNQYFNVIKYRYTNINDMDELENFTDLLAKQRNLIKQNP